MVKCSVNHSIRESVSVSGSVSLRSVLLCFDACFIRAQNLNSFVFLKKEWNFANMYFLYQWNIFLQSLF